MNTATAPKQQRPHPQASSIATNVPKRKFIERELPFGIEDIYSEAKYLRRLIDAEKQLDSIFVKKQLELQESSLTPSKTKRILRIFLSSIASDQPWSFQNDSQTSTIRIPSWTFRIEGYLVDTTTFKIVYPPSRKFSSFFKSIIVEIQQPNGSSSSDENVVEWQKSPLGKECDGFELKRLGDQDVNLKIHFKPDYLTDKFKLDFELGQLLKIKYDTKPVILLALWKYISLNKLYQQHTVNNDEALSRIFNCDTMSFDSIPERLSRLLSPVDIVTLEYTVPLSNKENSQYASAYDMQVELPDPQLKPIYQIPAQVIKDVAFIDQKILELISLVHIGFKKRSFLKTFTENPGEFIQKYIDAICAGMVPNIPGATTIPENSKFGFEDLRKCDLYKQPWISDAIYQFLTSKMDGNSSDSYQ